MGLFDFWKSKDTETRGVNYINSNTFGTGIAQSIFTNNIPATSLSAIYAAVELISNSIAELPIYVKYRTEDSGSDIVKEHAVSHALHNSQLTKFMLVKQLVSDMLLYGNGYAYIERATDGTPLHLIYCVPGSVTPVYNEKTRQLYYLCPLITTKKVEPINVIHLFKNTVNGYDGKGVLQYAYQTIKLANYTEKAAASFFSSGCNLGGILTTDNPRLTDQQKESIRSAWQQSHGGDNPNGVAVLEAGMKYQSVGVNGKDAQMLETRLFNLQEIARFFNISPTLLGDLTKSSYNTLEAANMEFLTHTLMPIITLIQDEFGRKLLKTSENNLYIDIDEAYIVKPDKSSLANYLSTLTTHGIISINEARQQLGYNPIENGDKHLIPFTNIQDNTIENSTDKNIDKEDNE